MRGVGKTFLKILLYSWMFYLPQIFSFTVWGSASGLIGALFLFLISSIGYTIRGMAFLIVPLGLLKMILRSYVTLTEASVEYFRPAALYGVIVFALRLLNMLIPEFFSSKGYTRTKHSCIFSRYFLLLFRNHHYEVFSQESSLSNSGFQPIGRLYHLFCFTAPHLVAQKN